MADSPVVDQLDTRLLETRAVVRTFVHEAAVAEVRPDGVDLVAEIVASRALTDGEPDTDDVPADGDRTTGRIAIDVISERIVRVRFAEGDAVPENRTPMLVHPFGGTRNAPVVVDGDTVRLAAGDTPVEVGLKPFSVRIGDACLIGGREKNAWSLWDTYNTGIQRTVSGGRPVATECFSIRPGEAVYGFGETFIGLDKYGQTLDLDMVEATGTTTPRSYKNIPFFVTTHGYGVFFNHSARMTCWVGSRCAPDLQVAVEDDFLDYFVILGDVAEVLDGYTDITGKGAVPPAWSFGWWQSKISYRSAAEALDVVRRLRAVDLPLDVLHLDTHWFRHDWFCDLEFDPERFGDPKGFLAELAEMGVKVSLWQLPYIPEPSRLFSDLEAVGGFVRDANGGVYDVALCYATDPDLPLAASGERRVGCIDFTNPEACRVYGDHLRRLFELGARVIKVDFGEQAPLDGVYHDGTPGHRAHNLYPLLYNQAVSEITAEATGEQVIWARSAWAGSQRYPVHWGGDSSANFDNLIPQIHGGLSLGLSGFQFWSHDIGGFLGEPDRDLLVRWLQAGVFCSHARIHGFGVRELDAYDTETLRIARDYIQLRYRLMPYLLATARDCVARSVPMARPLVVDFQHDPNTWRIGDQWLLGDDLLVAPISDRTGRRRVYLPAGPGWIDWWTGERCDGGEWIDVEASLEVLPLYLREGAVVPMWPVMRYVGERAVDEIVLRVAPFADHGRREARILRAPGDDGVSATYTATPSEHRVVLGDRLAEIVVSLDVLDRRGTDVRLVAS